MLLQKLKRNNKEKQKQNKHIQKQVRKFVYIWNVRIWSSLEGILSKICRILCYGEHTWNNNNNNNKISQNERVQILTHRELNSEFLFVSFLLLLLLFFLFNLLCVSLCLCNRSRACMSVHNTDKYLCVFHLHYCMVFPLIMSFGFFRALFSKRVVVGKTVIVSSVCFVCLSILIRRIFRLFLFHISFGV